MFWATHPTMTISEEEKKEKNKSLLEAEGRFSYWTKVDTINAVFMLFHLWSQPPQTRLKSGTISWAPVIGAVVSANAGSRSLHGPESSAAPADSSCLVGGPAALSGRHHLSVPLAPCQRPGRSSCVPPPPPIRKKAACCIKVASLHGVQKLPHQRGGTRRTARRSRPLSLHLSLDFPDSDSPGVSQLGHQLHSWVNCSSKRSGQTMQKERLGGGGLQTVIHRHAHISGA